MIDNAAEPVPARPRRRTEYVSAMDWDVFSEFKAGITGRKGEALVRRELARLGSMALHDVILPYGDSVTQVDHLVLARDAIMVIETKTYGGHVTGNPAEPNWMQHSAEGEWRYLFRNPLRQNDLHCRAVGGVVDRFGVDVRGHVVFVGTATFCEALAGRVLGLSEIAGAVEAGTCSGAVTEPARRAWRRLVEASAESEPRREEHRRRVDPRAAAVASKQLPC